jgi:hypothetical protein
MARGSRDDTDSKYFPTYYSMGGKWGFTCVYCKRYLFGFDSKGYAEQGMLDHYDECIPYVQSHESVSTVQLREEVPEQYRSNDAPNYGGIRRSRGYYS